jgi:hypothetical protein
MPNFPRGGDRDRLRGRPDGDAGGAGTDPGRWAMRGLLRRLRSWRRRHSYAAEVLRDDPLGYWPLGSDLGDATGNGHDLTRTEEAP